MDQTTETSATTAPHKKGIGLIGLIALVISSSIGSGVFALSTDISAAAAPGPAIIAWLITGIGFIALANTFGRLSLERPNLDGIVAYAREGFGPFVGFVSGWGYWLSIWIGNVAFGVMLATAIGYFFPPFAGELTVGAVIFISVINWLIVLLVNRGIEEASVVNAIVMICKLVPIFVFIVAMLLMFSFDVFTASVLPYGYLTRDELLQMGSPSMAYIFQEVVGPWGGAFISGGLVISIFGAWLSYTILASEAMNRMARMELLPRSFSKLNDHNAPTSCLIITGFMIQLLSIVMLFSEAAYQFAYSLRIDRHLVGPRVRIYGQAREAA